MKITTATPLPTQIPPQRRVNNASLPTDKPIAHSTSAPQSGIHNQSRILKTEVIDRNTPSYKADSQARDTVETYTAKHNPTQANTKTADQDTIEVRPVTIDQRPNAASRAFSQFDSPDDNLGFVIDTYA